MTVLILYINLLNLSWIKMSILRNMAPLTLYVMLCRPFTDILSLSANEILIQLYFLLSENTISNEIKLPLVCVKCFCRLCITGENIVYVVF